MDALDLLQKAWVFEVVWLILNFTAVLWWPSEGRAAFFMNALPLLTALIGGQGAIAALGPEAKRLIEAWREVKGK